MTSKSLSAAWRETNLLVDDFLFFLLLVTITQPIQHSAMMTPR
jgi:hypothetical protein